MKIHNKEKRNKNKRSSTYLRFICTSKFMTVQVIYQGLQSWNWQAARFPWQSNLDRLGERYPGGGDVLDDLGGSKCQEMYHPVFHQLYAPPLPRSRTSDGDVLIEYQVEFNLLLSVVLWKYDFYLLSDPICSYETHKCCSLSSAPSLFFETMSQKHPWALKELLKRSKVTFFFYQVWPSKDFHPCYFNFNESKVKLRNWSGPDCFSFRLMTGSDCLTQISPSLSLSLSLSVSLSLSHTLSHTHTSCIHRWMCTCKPWQIKQPPQVAPIHKSASLADVNTCVHTSPLLKHPLTLTHTLPSLSLSMLSGTELHLWQDQSKTHTLPLETNTITTTFVPFVSLSLCTKPSQAYFYALVVVLLMTCSCIPICSHNILTVTDP